MGTEEWHADIEVTPDLVKSCVASQFPELAPIETLEQIGEGWDNKVFLINQTIIFRFPHRKVAVELIERENKVLGSIHKRFELQIPNPEYIGKPAEAYPYPFQGYQKIVGEPGCRVQLSEKEKFNSLIKLASFLKTLHSIRAKEAFALGAHDPYFDRADKTHMLETLKPRIKKIMDQQIFELDKRFLDEVFKKTEQLQVPREKDCLIHGDLYCRHLLFNQGQLTGVIDWGDLAISAPAVDLAVVHSFYPKAWHQDFLKIYGDVDADSWEYARFLGLRSTLTLMHYGHVVGDEFLIKESKASFLRMKN